MQLFVKRKAIVLAVRINAFLSVKGLGLWRGRDFRSATKGIKIFTQFVYNLVFVWSMILLLRIGLYEIKRKIYLITLSSEFIDIEVFLLPNFGFSEKRSPWDWEFNADSGDRIDRVSVCLPLLSLLRRNFTALLDFWKLRWSRLSTDYKLCVEIHRVSVRIGSVDLSQSFHRVGL